MVVCGIVLLAIGIGALLDLSIWPVVLIALGGALLLSVVTGANKRRPDWFSACCWSSPSAWPQRGRQPPAEAGQPGSGAR